MKNTIIALATATIAIGSVNAQSFTNATFGPWVNTSADPVGGVAQQYTSDIRLNGVVAGQALVSLTGAQGVTNFTVVGASAAQTTLQFDEIQTNPQARVTWNFTANAGFQIDGSSLFSVSTDLANPTLQNTTSLGVNGVVNDPTGLLSSHLDGQTVLSGDTIVFNSGSIPNGIPVADHSRQWSIDYAGGRFLSTNYRPDRGVNTIASEQLAFDVQISEAAPVPEPSSALLLGLGAFGLLGRRKR